jgi:hypothetical protein
MSKEEASMARSTGRGRRKATKRRKTARGKAAKRAAAKKKPQRKRKAKTRAARKKPARRARKPAGGVRPQETVVIAGYSETVVVEPVVIEAEFEDLEETEDRGPFRMPEPGKP